MYESIKLDLSLPQVQRLAHGKTIAIAHHQIGKGHDVLLEKKKCTKIRKAHREGKGCRLALSADEFDVQGGSFLDFLKKAGKFIKEKVIDSDFYQQNVRPVVRDIVNSGVNMLAPRLGPAANIARKGVDALGSKTGAFGINKLLDGTPSNPILPLSDFSKPDFTVVGRGRLQKGSSEAKAWGEKMRALKAQKRGGSFKTAGSGSFR